MPTPDKHDAIVNVIKGLVMDATRKANSGHPGGPMSSADFAAIVYREFLRYDPEDPNWFNRDRFVLSAGHSSMLLYSLLHLAGFLGLDEVKNFRQLHSLTPGHPEHDLTPGVEATTGPLGQGMSMAVGMAAAEAHLRAVFGEDICEHYTYVAASDGDLQEGVSFGAASLAGHWGLGKLIVLYDANDIQLSGPTSRADCTDYRKVYEGICWQVLDVPGHDPEAIRAAIREARAEAERPTLIICRTVIAKGSAHLEGDFETHGAPLSPEEIAATKKKLGLPEDQSFYVPEDVVAAFRANHPELKAQAAAWRKAFEAKKKADTAFSAAWDQAFAAPASRSFSWPRFEAGKSVATRSVWGKCLEALIDQLPNLVGGSADLDPSNMTAVFRDKVGIFSGREAKNRNFAFGVREFPMGAIVNGLMLHGGLVAFGATFLTFSDYERNAIRMSALQKLPALHIFTHDSFYLGEDGPTHQSIEHTSSLRLIPDLLVFRPADATETCLCLETALRQDEKPSVLLFTRQGLPVMDSADYPSMAEGVARGGYVLRDAKGAPEVVLIATGSEVSLAIAAADLLPEVAIRVVSMPCTELFDAQPEAYKAEVLPEGAKLYVAAEAGATAIWHKYVGRKGLILGIDHFGLSAPASVLAKEYGFTPDNLAALIRQRLQED